MSPATARAYAIECRKMLLTELEEAENDLENLQNCFAKIMEMQNVIDGDAGRDALRLRGQRRLEG